MPNRAAASAEAERLLRQARRAYSDGALNISLTEVDKARFKRDLVISPWQHWVMSADYSYFVARTLLSQGVHLYGLFCAHQCVEVYLKAFLRSVGATIPETHRLQDILIAARNATPDNAFVHSEHAETVCLRYEPFYEIARYPVPHSRPNEGQWFWASGVDETILDYFVYRMRESLALSADAWDILAPEGHYHLEMVRENHPQFYAHFVHGNMNFTHEP